MKRNGFTLIELIAVIVILAIIALVAIPVITGIVDKSKKGAAEASALNYIDAVEKYVMLHDLDSVKYPYDLRNNTFNVSSNTEVSLLDIIIPKAKAEGTVPSLNSFINIKGEKPKSGTVTIDKKGKVTAAELVIGKFYAECTGNKCDVGANIPVELSIDGEDENSIKMGDTLNLKVTTNSNKEITWTSSDDNVVTVSNGVVTGVKIGSATITASIGDVSDSITINVMSGATKNLNTVYSTTNVKQEGVKGIVYLNPANLGATCTASNTITNPTYTNYLANTNECMKWYIFDDASDKYKLILDHDIHSYIKWGTGSYEQSNIKQEINNFNWDLSLNTRILRVDEFLKIIDKQDFNYKTAHNGYDFNSATGKGTSKYAWLISYKYNCLSKGCDYESNSYASNAWLDSGLTNNNYHWRINPVALTASDSSSENAGIRPVIEVSKNIMS